MGNDRYLLGQEHPWDQLEHQADTANFVVISGLAVDVDDLIDAINGKEIDPILTRAELNTAYAMEESGFMERVGEGMKRRIRNLKTEKNRRIAALLRDSSIQMGHGVTDIKLPRREQILIAISKGKLRYSSLTEFLGQFVELTEHEADLVAATVAEVRGGISEARPATQISAKTIKGTFPPNTIQGFERTMNVEDLGDFPIFLLERAILEIPPHEDDYQYFEEIRADRGVQVGFVVESAAGTAAFAVPLVAFAASIASVSTGWLPKEFIELMLSPTGAYLLGGGATVKVAQTFSKCTPVTDRLRASAHTRALKKSSGRLKAKYEALARAIVELKQTAIGSLRLLMLKEFILAHRDGGNYAAMGEVQNWVKTLDADPRMAEQFEDFAGTRRSDLSTFAEAEGVWSEFPRYQAAARSIPDASIGQSHAKIAQARKLPQ